MDGCMERYINERTDVWMHGCIDGLMHGCMYGEIHEYIH